MSILTLSLTVLGSIALLLFLVMKVRLHAFVALIAVSLLAGIATGMPLSEISESMQKGMGGTLGFLSIVVALGAMFGKIMEKTGGLHVIAQKIVKVFGSKNSDMSMGFAGLICALPLFFDVAIVLLIGLAKALTRELKGNLVAFVVPLFAGVAAAAAFLVPSPVPLLVAEQLGADLGWFIVIGLSAALPGMFLAGPLYGKFISKKIFISVEEEVVNEDEKRKFPPFSASIILLLLPLILVGLRSVGTQFWAKSSFLYSLVDFLGHPFFALLVTLVASMIFIARPLGFSRSDMMDMCSAAIQPVGLILLVTGAGGVFKQVLIDSGVGAVIASELKTLPLALPIITFLVTATIRVMQGSATVASLTGVGLILPLIGIVGDVNSIQLAALAVCVGGGSIVLSHVNDSGFWLFSKFTGATELQTLKTWTVVETILGVTGAVVGTLAYMLAA